MRSRPPSRTSSPSILDSCGQFPLCALPRASAPLHPAPHARPYFTLTRRQGNGRVSEHQHQLAVRRTPLARVLPDVIQTARLAAPLVLAELGWMAMGLVDTAFVGHVSAEALA